MVRRPQKGRCDAISENRRRKDLDVNQPLNPKVGGGESEGTDGYWELHSAGIASVFDDLARIVRVGEGISKRVGILWCRVPRSRLRSAKDNCRVTNVQISLESRPDPNEAPWGPYYIAAPSRIVKNRIVWRLAWPGLQSLWLQGDVRGLFWALVFALAVNAALIDTLVWPDLFQFGSPFLVWGLVGMVWIAGCWLAVRDDSTSPSGEDPAECEGDALFIQAQTEYLSGHWDEAVWLLERRLSQVPRDLEARLLLATLHRHQRRFAAAEAELRTVLKYDGSIRWQREIDREFDLARQFQGFESLEPAADTSASEPAGPTDRGVNSQGDATVASPEKVGRLQVRRAA